MRTPERRNNHGSSPRKRPYKRLRGGAVLQQASKVAVCTAFPKTKSTSTAQLEKILSWNDSEAGEVAATAGTRREAEGMGGKRWAEGDSGDGGWGQGGRAGNGGRWGKMRGGFNGDDGE